MATVRIADDVNEAMKALAAADSDGRSVTQLVDLALRQHAGLVPAGAPADRARRATVGRPRARTARLPRDPAATRTASCQHPPGRRIGNTCMVCGRNVSG